MIEYTEEKVRVGSQDDLRTGPAPSLVPGAFPTLHCHMTASPPPPVPPLVRARRDVREMLERAQRTRDVGCPQHRPEQTLAMCRHDFFFDEGPRVRALLPRPNLFASLLRTMAYSGETIG